MRFSKLTIRNFRSFDAVGAEFAFSEDRNLAALIGPNGAGKSNVLEALAIVLGVAPYSRFQPSDDDFHGRDRDNDLLIRLDLAPPLVVQDVWRRDQQIVALQFRGWRKKKGEDEGVPTKEHLALGADGKPLMLHRQMIKKGANKETGEVYDNRPWPVQATEHARKLGRPYFIHAFDLDRFFSKKSGWSPLARLVTMFIEDFQRTGTTCKIDGKEITTARAFVRYSEVLPQMFRTKKLTEIEAKIAERVATYVGHQSTPLKIGFGITDQDQLIRDLLNLLVSDRAGLPALPVDRLGDGYRALLRLAVIETLVKLDEAPSGHILLIEEPETFLHVHLARYFYDVLRKLADQGNQIVYTTHSPAFVDLEYADEVVRVSRTGASSEPHQLPSGEELDFTRVNKKVRSGNEELFFASCAILLEGEDDKAAFSVAMEKAGVDCNAQSISLVDCKGAGSLPDYIKLCGSLGIDFFVVHDEDDPTDVSQEKRNTRISDAIGTFKTVKTGLHLFQPDLEAVLKLKVKVGAAQIIELLDALSQAEIAAQYPDFWNAVESFLGWRAASQASQDATDATKGGDGAQQ